MISEDGLEHDYQPAEYFFDTNPNGFASILDSYRSGHLHVTSSNCAVTTRDDLAYWGLDELTLEPCCAVKFYPEIEVCIKEINMEESEKQREIEREKLEDWGDSFVGRYRKILWNLFEYPSTSRAAQVGKKIVLFSTKENGMVLFLNNQYILYKLEQGLQIHNGTISTLTISLMQLSS